MNNYYEYRINSNNRVFTSKYTKESYDVQIGIPDSNFEICVNQGEIIEYKIGSQEFKALPKVFLWTPFIKPYKIRPKSGSILTGYKIENHEILSLFGQSPIELQNDFVSLKDLDPILDSLIQSLIEENDSLNMNFFLSSLNEYRIKRSTGNKKQIMLMSQLKSLDNKERLKDISVELKLSRQYIHKLFKEYSGFSFKSFMQLNRIRNTIESVYKCSGENLTNIAYENNYYDQAHFNRKFKSIFGESPKSFFKKSHFLRFNV